MVVRPRIAEVNCHPIHFGPEDRVLVKTSVPLKQEAWRRLRRSVARWAGVDEERVLIYCPSEFTVERDDGKNLIIGTEGEA